MEKDNLFKLIIQGIIGMVIGIILAMSAMDSSFFSAIILGLFFAGLPYGWSLSTKYIGGMLISSNPAVLVCSFMLKLVISIFIGWIAYPIMLIYTIYKVISNKV
ncbi:MAG: hypothetical protein IJ323_06495 [Clostridia bacterium]|nr:hypothetical protein [Clostridia bacterium]